MSTPCEQISFPPPVWVWGLPLSPFTFVETLDAVESLIARGEPSYFITANLRYAMLTDRTPRLSEVNRRAAFITADGMPLVWASRQTDRPLPERVAGSDLVPAICERAARHGWRIFLLGGEQNVAEDAARNLVLRFPGLRIVGTESPPFRPLTQVEHAQLLERVHTARPHLLFVAFGQPKGELWLAEHIDELRVPVCAQVGATLDMIAGRVRRAPGLVQRVGMEWAWRIATDPRRLAPRYAEDVSFLARKVFTSRFRANGTSSKPLD